MIMKILLSLCSILFFLCTNSAAQQESDAVFDQFNHELKAGGRYYLVPVNWGSGGGGFGVSNYDDSGSSCPSTVTREPCDNDRGFPVSFHPANPDETVIRLSQSLNIRYETSVPCANSTVWRAGHLDSYTRSFLVELGGEQGNPGCETARNWFKIERADYTPGAYKLVLKPRDICGNTVWDSDVFSGWAFGLRPVLLGDRNGGFEVRFANADDVAVGGAHKAYVQ